MKNFKKHSTSFFYLFIALLTLVLCVIENMPYYRLGLIDGFIPFIKDAQVTNSSRSISVDILAIYFVALVYMWQRSKEIGRRYFFIGLLLSTWIAVGVGLPFFLAVREFKRQN